MTDPADAGKQTGDVVQQRIVDRRTGTHQMRGQRRLRRAHAPDVAVVHGDDARQRGQHVLDGLTVDTRRDRVERESLAMRDSPAQVEVGAAPAQEQDRMT